ncbi:MAG TPA: hypothetical protein VFT57_19030 [Gemmatimonadaceae bacterium]|nr:hypothetical protein [Gemmatimonadaceae bacterium]
MNRFQSIVAVGVAIAGASCASSHSTPEPQPTALAALNAEMSIVGSDTTWVVHGPGYELVARSRDDLAQVQPALDWAAEMMQRVFPADTLAPIVARVRRIPARRDSVTVPAAVPSSLTGTVVELPVPDAKLTERMAKERKGRDGATLAAMMSGRTITPAVRAWLSAHADRVTGTRASAAAASGRVPDQRVPDWAVDMLTQLGDSASTARYATALAAHPERMVPLVEFLVMRSDFTSELAGGGPGGRYPGGGDEGGIDGGPETGGMPGRGGGRGGMGGMGGMRGGRRGPPRRDRGGDRGFALSGRLLYSAESAVLGEFLSREGYDVIGQLVDAQIAARPIDDVLARHGLGGLAQADESFRQWVSQHAVASR